MLPSHAIVKASASYDMHAFVVTVTSLDGWTGMTYAEIVSGHPQSYAWCPELKTFLIFNEVDNPHGPGSGWTESPNWAGTYEVPECVKARILKTVAR